MIAPLPSTLESAVDLAPERTLIDILLAEQSALSAVDRFAHVYDAGPAPAQARYYAALLPANPPRPGEQLAFEVDLDACSGCKACVTACHSMNGLDDAETWREVGLLHGGSNAGPIVQHVTAACHHCLDPACLNVCPVQAYQKDPVTGIVKHLDDQCFGCQYCILACPYSVPKYNASKGIVRKCDMCSARLSVGEAPACVQGCPQSAIRIITVKREDVVADCETGLFLPGAPDPQFTLPTTNYRRREVFPRNTLPADYFSIQVEHAHVPLVVMLVLTQLSVGAFVVEQAGAWLYPSEMLSRLGPAHALGALAFGVMALVASTLHLGRPQYAFRAVLGLRRSWLSREILAFGLFAGLASLYAALMWQPWLPQESMRALRSWVGGAVVMTGLAGVACSVMIYQCTRRPFWNGTATTIKFLLTAVWLGAATVLATSFGVACLAQQFPPALMMREFGTPLCRSILVVASAKLLYEGALFMHLYEHAHSPLKRSALLMTGILAKRTLTRFACGLLGGVALPALLLSWNTSTTSASPHLALALVEYALVVGSICTLSIAGELLERYLFFTASVAPKMPGGIHP